MSKTNVEALNALCEKLGKTSNADTNLEALKNIYNALSGETSNADLISAAIDDITTVAKKPVEVAWVQGTVSRDFAQVNIPNGVTSIGNGAFSEFSSLDRITIPDSVTSIGNSAFSGCSSLENIYYKGTEEQWNAITKGSGWNADMGSGVEGGTVITYHYTG